MRYKRDKIYIPMARWANQHNVFRPMTFKQFLELKENKKYKLLYDLQDGVNRTLYQPDLLGVSND